MLASRVRAVCNSGSARHTYSRGPKPALQRPAESYLADPAFLAAAKAHGRYLLFGSHQRVCVHKPSGEPVWATRQQLETIAPPSHLDKCPTLLLGSNPGGQELGLSWRLAIDLSAGGPIEPPTLDFDTRFVDLRQYAGRAPADEAAAAAQARNLLHWHASHKFCGRCGTRTEPTRAGWQRSCGGCGAEHFPRLDSVAR